VNACIEIGTSCMLSLRRCAVTVISCRLSLLALGAAAVSGPSAGDASTVAPNDTLPNMAAIALESFEFIAASPF
jgi:hypothetical protein